MGFDRRQIWAQAGTPSTSATTSCPSFLLPSNGVITINSSFTLSVTENAYYQPACTGDASLSHVIPSSILDNSDPFYASVGPQLYAIGCMTVTSYVLVIILLITPRKFYVGRRGADGNLLGRHGMISGSYSGNSSVTGVGGRPWLQKVAALSVAISLTLATVDSMHVAQRQYEMRYTDAADMTEEVIDGTEIRVVHCISSTFLWLAQVQTLIRLFPRHKEKVMIKWVGFALIVLDTIFAILDNFVSHGSQTHPRLFDDAIPALSYLFELALNLLYAAWVIFYSLSKHRFAFFHPKMRSICLVAMFSLSAICIPIIFFIMDIASPDVAGWGEYIRWVGSAAASVIVWEWVERIEALERDERKDGILGREIFDGDEMLEVTPSQEVEWPKQSSPRGDDSGHGTGVAWRGVIIPSNNRPMRRGYHAFHLGGRNRNGAANQGLNSPALLPLTSSAPSVPPPAAVTPISRADTTSAASTVYHVRYHTVASPTPPISTAQIEHHGFVLSQNKQDDVHNRMLRSNATHVTGDCEPAANALLLTVSSGWKRWFPMAGLFGTRRTSPPQEIATAQEEEENVRCGSIESDEDSMAEKYESPSATSSKLHRVLTSLHLGEWQNRFGTKTQKPLSVTIIPHRDVAQQPWSPQPNEPGPNDPMQGPSGLPVTVIPTHGRPTSLWPLGNTCNELGGNSQLQYDPETAALVEVEDPGSSAQAIAYVPDQLPESSPTEATVVSDGRASYHSEDHMQLLHELAAHEAGTTPFGQPHVSRH